VVDLIVSQFVEEDSVEKDSEMSPPSEDAVELMRIFATEKSNDFIAEKCYLILFAISSKYTGYI